MSFGEDAFPRSSRTSLVYGSLAPVSTRRDSPPIRASSPSVLIRSVISSINSISDVIRFPKGFTPSTSYERCTCRCPERLADGYDTSFPVVPQWLLVFHTNSGNRTVRTDSFPEVAWQYSSVRQGGRNGKGR